MICYKHHEKPAIALCKNCAVGVCVACAIPVGYANAVACSQECAEKANLLNLLNDQALKIYDIGKSKKGWRSPSMFGGYFFIALASLYLCFAAVEAWDLFMLSSGIIFLVAGLFLIYRVKKLKL